MSTGRVEGLAVWPATLAEMSFWFRAAASQNKMERNTVDTQNQLQAYTSENRCIPLPNRHTNTQTHTLPIHQQLGRKERRESKEGKLWD